MSNRRRLWSLLIVVFGLLVSSAFVPPAFAQETNEKTQTIRQENPVARAQSLVRKGRVVMKAGGVESACIAFRQATLVLPTWWIPRFEYVRCARLLGAPYEELIGHLEVALGADPGKPALRHLFGIIHEDHGEYVEARAAYEQTLALAPWMVEVHLRVGALAMMDGDFHRAKEAYEVAIRYAPKNMIARNQLADLYIHFGRPKEAIRHLEFVLKSTGYPGPTLAKLARLYKELGMTAAHRRVLRRLGRQ